MSIDFDALVLGPCMDTFGDPITWLPEVGEPIDMTGVFDDRFRETTYQDGVEVVDTHPVLGTRMVNFKGRLPLQGDLFMIPGRLSPNASKAVLYTIADPPKPDGKGHVRFDLRLATDLHQAIPLQ